MSHKEIDITRIRCSISDGTTYEHIHVTEDSNDGDNSTYRLESQRQQKEIEDYPKQNTNLLSSVGEGFGGGLGSGLAKLLIKATTGSY